MATQAWNQDAATTEAVQAQGEQTFSIEEVELACDEPVTVYGRMQP